MPAAKRFWEDVKEGDPLPEVRVDKLTRTDFVRYAGASGDFNPIPVTAREQVARVRERLLCLLRSRPQCSCVTC